MHEEQARSTAMREEAGLERGSGPIRPNQRDPSVQGSAARSSLDAAALTSFAQNLLGGSELGEMDGGLDAAEETEDLEVEIEGPVQERRTKKPRSARAPRQAHGGVAEEDGAGEPPNGAPAPDEGEERSRRWPRVSARKRLRLLDLRRLLQVGEETGLLVGWQASTVEPRVLALNSRAFHYLRLAHDALPGDLHRVVLLQAAAAHRTPEDFERLADVLADASVETVRAWAADRLERRDPSRREAPGPAPSSWVLEDHYDPCVHWLEETPHAPTADEEWPVPQWLRGARREALELCALAFLQCARDVFGPRVDEEDEGANDPLMAALELHGEAHPAIARWCLALAARAHDLPGLDCAADALLRARETLGQPT